METIGQAVGVRNGVSMMPNQARDLQTITGLLDRIPLASGGTAATPRMWATDRTLLIAQVTAAIVAFQTANRRPVIDGVVDPNGGTLKLMNQLATAGPPTATVVSGDVNSQLWVVAAAESLDGTGTLRAVSLNPTITRRLVKATNSSIKYFGVVVTTTQSGDIINGPPHIFFTPSPWQGGYQDHTYDKFAAWMPLWDKYTSIMGSQLAQSGAPQILVIPFYKNAQTGNLGTSFLANWKEIIKVVVTAAIDNIDATFLRGGYEFDRIFSSSFSNGIASQQNFNTRAAGAGGMTQMAFDLDGQASGSTWRPSPGCIYRNVPPGRSGNPIGSVWHVGGRFADMRRSYPQTTDHNLCPFLLFHGLSFFGR